MFRIVGYGHLIIPVMIVLGIGMWKYGSTPLVAQTPGSLNLVVLCSSCLPPGGSIARDMDKVGQWLLDLNTGDIWLYHTAAVQGRESPIYLGKLGRLGDPVQPR